MKGELKYALQLTTMGPHFVLGVVKTLEEVIRNNSAEMQANTDLRKACPSFFRSLFSLLSGSLSPPAVYVSARLRNAASVMVLPPDVCPRLPFGPIFITARNGAASSWNWYNSPLD